MMFSKAHVDYEEHAKGNDHCRECRHFEDPRACQIVLGPINPDGWCLMFDAKQRERVRAHG